MMLRLKTWYVNFIDKDKRNIPEKFFYGFLCLASYIYGFGVAIRNFLYDKNIIPSYYCKAKVIGIGNLSWSGSGKTPLSIWLCEKLSPRFRVAILRRGYGEDENKMILEKKIDVFSLPDRYKLAKKLESSFDLFILDDGFGFRRLKRDVNIVIRGAREFRKKHRLIPAYFFREPLNSLKRADIVLLNYKNEIDDPLKIKKSIENNFSQLKVYFSRYRFKRFCDLEGNLVDFVILSQRNLASFCAIGYPQGFFRILDELNLKVVRQMQYPDHYQLSETEFTALQDELLKNNIKDLIITHKDKYHLPSVEFKLNIIIMEVELQIEDEDSFIQDISKRLS
jgi:tetraacyldisaccharide 4'-kinase